jgi:hypothetical protein
MKTILTILLLIFLFQSKAQSQKIEDNPVQNIAINLNEGYSEVYSKYNDEVIREISEYSKYNYSPSFKSLYKTEKKYVRFKSVYNLHYELELKYEPDIVVNNIYIQGNKWKKTICNFELVSGTDKSLKFFERAKIELNPIYEGEKIFPTKISFYGLQADLTKGITEFKLKKGTVEFTNCIPEKDLQAILISEILKNEKLYRGYYILEYEIGDIVGEKKLRLKYRRTKFKDLN